MAPRSLEPAASSAHVRSRSSGSTPIPIVCLTMPAAVRGAPDASAFSASFSHCARLTTASCLARDRTALSTIFSTTSLPMPCPSSSLAAAIQMDRSAGSAFLAWLRTFRAFSCVSNRAKASHISTECGTFSTATPSKIRASSASSNSIAAFHNVTLVGLASSALRSTAFLAAAFCSKSAARRNILTLVGMCRTAAARIVLPISGGCNLAASSHTSSLSGQDSHPSWMSFRA
mmetsp:Transcript_34419/g.101180  ORF Transcript_34419/g.101180 Transcript_34419/m.101180 type:complete len:231 (-) Transcript_34419:808-1500(-)